MSATSVSQGVEVRAEGREAVILVGVAISSFAALLLELSLTRLFSFVLFYHYAFLAISVAMLGLGAGGVFAYLRREWLLRWSTRSIGSGVSVISFFAVILILDIIRHSQVQLDLSWSNFRGLTIIYISSAIPFFLTGLLFSVVFARNPGRISRLYGADLVGGALACLSTVPMLNFLGAPNTILFTAIMMAVAATIWTVKNRRRVFCALLAALLLAFVVVNTFHTIVDVIYAKGVMREGVGVEYARWNAISRVEVYKDRNGLKAILIDAAASTLIMNVDPHHWEKNGWQQSLMNEAPAMCNVLRPHGEFAIIGPGGGIDVVRAVGSGSQKVTGIEINPIIVNKIMKGRYADYSQHLYEIPEVHIHVSDGRSFVRNSHDRYDVLQMTLVDTWASTAAGAFALSENYLYTVEAFQEYFEHLKSDGMIAITRWEFKQPREALRVVSVAMEALRRLGVSNLASHFIVISEGPLQTDGRPVLVLAKKSPFTSGEEATASAYVRSHPSIMFQYRPSQRGNNAFAQLIASNDPYAFARQYQFNVSPVSDDNPFFFFTLKLSQVLRSNVVHGIDWKVNVGVAVLGIVLVLSLLAVLSFLVVPLALAGKGRQKKILPLLYFIAIGLGYIMVEIAFIQRFVLFLGHPTYALTVVVFLMLFSSGTGSLVSRRLLTSPIRRLWPLGLIVLVILVYILLLPVVLPSLVGLAFPVRLTISGVFLIPLGFAMGMPFPTGLRALAGESPESPVVKSTNDNSVEWAWAMNAASSVLGSVLAIVIAVRFGLNATLACGAAAYITAILVSRTLEMKRV